MGVVMGLKNAKKLAGELLSYAGIVINGKNDYDIQITDDRFYHAVFSKGELGFGESYMNGWWNCKKIDELVARILKAHLDRRVKNNFSAIALGIEARLFDLQSKHRAFIVGKEHYDLDNRLFELMLDKTMSYSCAYFTGDESLDAAQEHKLELICKKLDLKRGMKLLDIGSGWGGLAKYAAVNYGVQVTGVTISKRQFSFAKSFCRDLPVDFILEDYRDIKGKYDRIVSVGMFEHVGYKNYKTFMKVVNRSLKNDGLFLLHTIGSNISTASAGAWTQKYIFPNGMLPSIKQIGSSMEGIFIMENWDNIGINYYKTLMHWYDNFTKNWNKISDVYDDRFYRMWTFYLLSSAGGFKARENQVWQILVSKQL